MNVAIGVGAGVPNAGMPNWLNPIPKLKPKPDRHPGLFTRFHGDLMNYESGVKIMTNGKLQIAAYM